MSISHPIFLAGVSLIAMASATHAQDTAISQIPGSIVLAPITLIADGQENIEATGGVVVTAEDIQAMQPADASELFARDSAVSVSGGAGPSKRIHVLGFEQSSLAVSVDGVPQFKDNWHHSGSSVIDPALLKQVEVEAGAAAADAGFAAAAGAVRYETLGARDLLTDGRSMGGRAGLSYGSNGRGLSASLAGYGLHDGFDWFVMLHSAQGDNYESGDGYELPGSEPAMFGALVKAGYENENHRVELSYEHGEDDADRVVRMNMDQARTTDVYPLRVTRDTVSLKYTTTAPTASWDPEALLYAGWVDYWRPDFIDGSARGDMQMEARTVGGVVKNVFEVGPGNITTGVDFARDRYTVDNYGDTDVAIHRIETRQIGAFAQGRFAFDNGIDLSTGLRADHHRFTDWNDESRSDSGISANATLSYEFAPGYEVFAAASRSWMGYDIGEYGYLHARDSSLVTSPDFEPATARNYKLGFNATQDRWTGNLTLFETTLTNLANDYLPALDNAEELRSRGVTVQLNYGWDTGRIGASLTKARLTEDGQRVLPNGGNVIPVGEVASIYVDQDIPQYNLTVGATLELASRLSGDYLTDGGFDQIPGYGVLNAYAEWRPASQENVVLRLGVDNLLDKTYYERGSYARNFDRNVYPVQAPGRTVTLGLNVDF